MSATSRSPYLNKVPPRTPALAPLSPSLQTDYFTPRRPHLPPSTSYTPSSTSLSALWTPLSPTSPTASSPGHSVRTTRRQKPAQPQSPSSPRCPHTLAKEDKRKRWPPRNAYPRPPRPDSIRRNSSDDSHSSSSSSSALGSPPRFMVKMKRPNTWPSHTSTRHRSAQGAEFWGEMTQQERLEMVYTYIQHPGKTSDEDMEDRWDVMRMRIRECVQREGEHVLVGQEDWI